MPDTTVFTISAGYLPYLAHDKKDFNVMRRTSGKSRKSAAGIEKFDGIEIKGPDIIMADGTLRRARVRGSLGWFEYSTQIKPIHKKTMDKRFIGSALSDKVKEMAAEWYGRDMDALNQNLLQSFINTGLLGEIDVGEEYLHRKSAGGPAGVTPEEMVRFDEKYGVKVGAGGDAEDPSSAGLVGRANDIDMYWQITKGDRKGEIIRADVTAMSFDKETAHHGLSSLADRQKHRVTGPQLMKDIKEGGHHVGSPAQENLWNYFQKQNRHWNRDIKAFRDRYLKPSDMPAADAVPTKEMLGQIRPEGGAKAGLGQRYEKVQAHIEKEKNRILSRWESGARQTATMALGKSGRTETRWQSVVFALHALGNLLKIADTGGKGKEYGYRTNITLGEKSHEMRKYVVEVMHQINFQGDQYLLFKDLDQEHVQIHPAGVASEILARELLQADESAKTQIIVDAFVRANSIWNARFTADGNDYITVGAITNAAMNQIDNNPAHRYSSVLTDPKVNKDINKFIASLYRNPKKLRDMLGSAGKTINLTDTRSNYKRLQEQNLGMFYPEHEGGMSKGAGSGLQALRQLSSAKGDNYWGLDRMMSTKLKQKFKEQTVPDFWAAPYISLLYPSVALDVTMD